MSGGRSSFHPPPPKSYRLVGMFHLVEQDDQACGNFLIGAILTIGAREAAKGRGFADSQRFD